jgi:hypothetical protein
MFKVGDLVIEKKRTIQYGITDSNAICQVVKIEPLENHSKVADIRVNVLFTRISNRHKWEKKFMNGYGSFDVDGNRFVLFKGKLPKVKDV